MAWLLNCFYTACREEFAHYVGRSRLARCCWKCGQSVLHFVKKARLLRGTPLLLYLTHQNRYLIVPVENLVLLNSFPLHLSHVHNFSNSTPRISILELLPREIQKLFSDLAHDLGLKFPISVDLLQNDFHLPERLITDKLTHVEFFNDRAKPCLLWIPLIKKSLGGLPR
jgi:hypothetical protein